MRSSWLLAGKLLLAAAATTAAAADVQYSVVAFPGQSQGVAVSVDGQTHALTASQQNANLFQGSAPSGSSYQYILTGGSGDAPESTKRTLAQGATTTGNEFFNRSQTVYDVPSLPQAYNPIFPPLFTGMNKSNEVATILLQANMSGLQAILDNPTGDNKAVEVYNMTYISNKEIYSFTGASIKNSGQSTKDFGKQSYSIDLNKFSNSTTKSLLYGRTTIKLRAEETDPSFVREKLLMDCLAAAGAATLSGSWTRLYVNGQAFGLFLMIDDASTHFIDDVLHGGNSSYPYTGVTYKGNALSDTQEANLQYLGDDPTKYSADLYKAEDDGEQKLNKTNEMYPLIDLTKRIANATDLSSIVNVQHTLTHMAFNFLSGSWDGFWYQASNYYLNQDTKDNTWQVITYDFDETFGSNLENQSLIDCTYQDFRKPNAQKRPLQDTLVAQNASTLEDILKTVIKRFFKPSVIEPRLKAWQSMLREDIAWDRAIPAMSKGKAREWTVADFETNLFNTTKSVPGVLQWVQTRSAATAKQLNFDDKDDLPALGPYTGGTYGDGAVGADGVSPAGNSNSNGSGAGNGNGSSSSDTSDSSRTILSSHSTLVLLSLVSAVLSWAL